MNTDPAELFYGNKYKVEKVSVIIAATQQCFQFFTRQLFEDNGSIASGITSVAYDADRRLLFLNGLYLLVSATLLAQR